YWVVETTTPPGHTTAPPQQVTVAVAGNTPPGALTFVDPRLPGEIDVHKQDGDSTALAGAQFTLYTDTGTGPGVVVNPPAPGTAVVFRAVITNTSSVAVVLDSLTDEWPGHAAFSLGADCPSLLGTTLDAGHSVTCLFTVAGYAPPAGSSRVDTVIAGVHEATNPANTASAQDTSTVSTRSAGGNPPSPPPPVLSISV